ncbi:hypothetical protein QUN99_003408 [Vibrio parahaemolyticus]|nr:hypothetical protein [Vibrio parahaemolyticus]
MNTSTQSNSRFNVTAFPFVVLFMGLFTIFAFQSTNPARMVAGFIILATISLVAYTAFGLIRLLFQKISARQSSAKVQKKPVTKPVVVAQSIPSENTRRATARRANAFRRMPGEEMMEIPAYARKAMGRDFPMSVSQLKKATFTIKSQSGFTF